jgi:hypothetical protein
VRRRVLLTVIIKMAVIRRRASLVSENQRPEYGNLSGWGDNAAFSGDRPGIGAGRAMTAARLDWQDSVKPDRVFMVNNGNNGNKGAAKHPHSCSYLFLSLSPKGVREKLGSPRVLPIVPIIPIIKLVSS